MHSSSHCPLFFTPPPFSHLKHKFTSVQVPSTRQTHTPSVAHSIFYFTSSLEMQILWLRPRETHLVTAMYLGCGCRAASLLSPALGLTGCCSEPVQGAEQQNESNSLVLLDFITSSVYWDSSLQGQVKRRGKEGDQVGECAQQRDWLKMLQSCCLQACFFNAGTLYILYGCLFWFLLDALTSTCCLTAVLPLVPSQQKTMWYLYLKTI